MSRVLLAAGVFVGAFLGQAVVGFYGYLAGMPEVGRIVGAILGGVVGWYVSRASAAAGSP